MVQKWLLSLGLALGLAVTAGSVGRGVEIPSWALPAPDSDLYEMLVLSSAGAPAVRARLAGLDEASANAEIAFSSRLPTVNGWANVGAAREFRQERENRNLSVLLYNLGLNQPLYHWGALKANQRRWENFRSAAGAEVEASLIATQVEVFSLWLALHSADANVSLMSQLLERATKERDYTLQMVDAGEIARSATSGVDGALEMARLNLDRAQLEQRRLLSRLARLTGGKQLRLKRELEAVSAEPAELQQWLRSLPRQTDSVRLRRLRALIAAEREQFAIERVRLRPKFSIGAGVGQENRNPVGDTLGEKTDITTVSTALNVQWSIFDGRASHHSKSASLARSRGLESELQGAMAEVSDALAESAARTEVEFSSLRINERALALARAGLDLSQADFEIGTLSRSQVEESKLNEVRAFHTATQARAEFYRAVADLLANHGTPLIEALNARESAGRLEPIASP